MPQIICMITCQLKYPGETGYSDTCKFPPCLPSPPAPPPFSAFVFRRLLCDARRSATLTLQSVFRYFVLHMCVSSEASPLALSKYLMTPCNCGAPFKNPSLPPALPHTQPLPLKRASILLTFGIRHTIISDNPEILSQADYALRAG